MSGHAFASYLTAVVWLKKRLIGSKSSVNSSLQFDNRLLSSSPKGWDQPSSLASHNRKRAESSVIPFYPFDRIRSGYRRGRFHGQPTSSDEQPWSTCAFSFGVTGESGRWKMPPTATWVTQAPRARSGGENCFEEDLKILPGRWIPFWETNMTANIHRFKTHSETWRYGQKSFPFIGHLR